MQFSTFTRPPHYQLRDADLAPMAVAPQSNAKVIFAALAAAACVVLGFTAFTSSATTQLVAPVAQQVQTQAAPMVAPVNRFMPSEVQVRQAQVAAATAAASMAPLAAQAAVTPSLKALGGSIVAGGVVLGAIALAVVLVSQFDQVKR